MSNIKKSFTGLGLFLTIVYPFVIYVLINTNFSVRYASIYILFIVLANFGRWRSYFLLIFGVLLSFFLIITNEQIFLKLYPILMNGGVCLLFLTSLRHKPLVSYFAEKMGYEITADVQHYTRKATLYWGIFMLTNTFISAITLCATDFVWALYNGFISYILIGLAFLIELFIRRRCMHV